MTIQALIFLHQLKVVQKSEIGTIEIDSKAKEMRTVIDPETCADVDQITINLSKKWKSVDSMTDYLQEEGYLVRIRPGYFYLSHKGYHYVQTIVSLFAWFLFKSIAVPIIVALLTTLITLWVQGAIQLNHPA